MKRTNAGIPLTSHAAWMGLVLLLGLLLSACEAAGAGDETRRGIAEGAQEGDGATAPVQGTDPGAASEEVAVITLLPEKCFLVDNDGRIRRFDSAIPDCDITAFEIPMDKGDIRIVAIHDEAFRGKSLTKLIVPNSITTIGSHTFADNPIVRVILDPNASLTFDNTSFPNNLWDAYSAQSANQVAGTWTWNSVTSMWSFAPKQ